MRNSVQCFWIDFACAVSGTLHFFIRVYVCARACVCVYFRLENSLQIQVSGNELFQVMMYTFKQEQLAFFYSWLPR